MGINSVMVLTEKPLTDLFYTQAFSGSWTIFSKFNWLGAIMQFFISATCLLALFLIVYQRLVTLFYLSSRPLFDKVHEIKQQGKGQKFLGLPALASNTLMTANHGTGLDAIFSFVLSLLPDVKAYSDYSEERGSYNLQEDDTCTTYILKISIPTIMLIFFFAIGFNGTLFKAYGNVVDAMGTATDNLVTTELSTYVQKWMNSGSAYQFSYSADETEFGKFRQNLAKDMYAKVLRKSSDLSTNAKLYIGQKIDAYLNSELADISENQVGNVSVPGFRGTDADCKNLEYSVVINATAAYTGTSLPGSELGGGGIAMSTFGISSDNADSTYMHVFVTKKNNADETNYFQVDEEDALDSTGGNSSNKSSGGKKKAPTGY